MQEAELAIAACVVTSFTAGLTAVGASLDHFGFVLGAGLTTTVGCYCAGGACFMGYKNNKWVVIPCVLQALLALAMLIVILAVRDFTPVMWVSVAFSALEAAVAVCLLALRSKETQTTWITPEVVRAREQIHEAFGIDVTDADVALVLSGGWRLVVTSDVPLNEKKLVKYKMCRSREEAKEALTGHSFARNTGTVVDAQLLRGAYMVSLV